MLYGDLARFSSAQLPPAGWWGESTFVTQEADAQSVGYGREMYSC